MIPSLSSVFPVVLTLLVIATAFGIIVGVVVFKFLDHKTQKHIRHLKNLEDEIAWLSQRNQSPGEDKRTIQNKKID